VNRRHICPSCFDVEAEKAAARYRFARVMLDQLAIARRVRKAAPAEAAHAFSESGSLQVEGRQPELTPAPVDRSGGVLLVRVLP